MRLMQSAAALPSRCDWCKMKRGHAICFFKRGSNFGGNIPITDLRFSKNLIRFQVYIVALWITIPSRLAVSPWTSVWDMRVSNVVRQTICHKGHLSFPPSVLAYTELVLHIARGYFLSKFFSICQLSCHSTLYRLPQRKRRWIFWHVHTVCVYWNNPSITTEFLFCAEYSIHYAKHALKTKVLYLPKYLYILCITWMWPGRPKHIVMNTKFWKQLN